MEMMMRETELDFRLNFPKIKLVKNDKLISGSHFSHINNNNNDGMKRIPIAADRNKRGKMKNYNSINYLSSVIFIPVLKRLSKKKKKTEKKIVPHVKGD